MHAWPWWSSSSQASYASCNGDGAYRRKGHVLSLVVVALSNTDYWLVTSAYYRYPSDSYLCCCQLRLKKRVFAALVVFHASWVLNWKLWLTRFPARLLQREKKNDDNDCQVKFFSFHFQLKREKLGLCCFLCCCVIGVNQDWSHLAAQIQVLRFFKPSICDQIFMSWHF